MKSVFSLLVRMLPISASFAALQACVDTSPIDYHAPIAEDAGPRDAAPVNSDAARVVECRQCVARDSCRTEYDKCAADAKCKVFIQCLLDSYCVNIPPDLSQLPPCLVTCGLQADIKSSEDSAIVLFRPVLFCIEAHCSAPCGG